MNRTTALQRKLVYLVILVAMLVPLYLLGQPSSGGGDLGGRLTEMRTDFNIAESDLGEISPASETMKLASLGLRGVAATLLWNKAHEYQITHEWDRLKAALNNIALLQPHYDKVWEHQAHNLSYNVSIQFDDYRQRYAMVREGAEFLTRGVRQNQRAPRLIWYLGWFYGQKMGKSDEKKEYRRLFAEDDVLHESLLGEGIDVTDANGPNGKPDNWLVGRLWLNRGYRLVDDAGVKIRRQTPLNFYETGPKSRMHHAEAIEKEGYLYDGAAERAWELAKEDWEKFGARSIPASNGLTIRLGELERLRQDRQVAIENFRTLVGSDYTDLVAERMKSSPDLLAVWEKDPADRTDAGNEAIERIEQELLPKFADIAKSADRSVRLRAINLVNEIAEIATQIQRTNGYRTQINYEYWLTLAQAEQEPRTVKARRLVFEAEKANADAELDKAIALYEEAFGLWAEIFEDYPILTIDDAADDLYKSIRRYMIAVDSQDLSEDFPLYTFTTMMRRNGSVDSQLYAEYATTQKEKAIARKKELEAEELERQKQEEEALKQKSETEEPESDASKPEMKKADEAEQAKSDAEKKDADAEDKDAEDKDAESSDKSDADATDKETEPADKDADSADKKEDEKSEASSEPEMKKADEAEKVDEAKADAPEKEGEPAETDPPAETEPAETDSPTETDATEKPEPEADPETEPTESDKESSEGEGKDE